MYKFNLTLKRENRFRIENEKLTFILDHPPPL